MSSSGRPPRQQTMAPAPLLAHLARWLEHQTDGCERLAWVLRDSLDELLNGQRTGRWCYQQLKKTEKTYLGTAVEVNLTNEFDISDGDDLDWKIDGHEVDCKFSKDFGGWEIPMEMYRCGDHGEQSGTADHLALLVWMNDDDAQWAAGVVQIRDDLLKFKSNDSGPPRRQYNRDNKRRLNDHGINTVHFLWGGLQDLPPNLLRQTSEDKRRAILLDNSGQQRVNALLREIQGKIVTRPTMLTVAQQKDPLKRVRDARLAEHLGGEGFLILGHQQADPHIARGLGLPVPDKGEFVSCRVVPAAHDAECRVWLGDGWWRLAHADEPAGPSPRTRPLHRPGSTVGRVRASGLHSAAIGRAGSYLEFSRYVRMSARCRATSRASTGGTAFPIWRAMSILVPSKMKVSGKLWSRAASRWVIGLSCSGCR